MSSSAKQPLGSPLFISKNYGDSNAIIEQAPKSGILSRASMKHDCDRKYQEELLQDVIHRWPDVLPVRDFYPSVTDLIPLGREIPVDLGGNAGFIDNLFVTNDAHLVIVETKLWRNPEATREVIAQTLQYGMALSKLSLDELEGGIRRSSTKGCPLGSNETILQRVTDTAAQGSLMELADEFENAFDRSRRDGEILLLIVTDGIHSSAERLVQWMNKVVGSAPYKFGLVELCIFDLEDGGRIVIPRTMLRVTEASRHVVIVRTEGPKQEVVYTVTGANSDNPPRKDKVTVSKPITDEILSIQIREQNSAEIAQTVEALRSELRSVSPKSRATPSSIQYGVDVNGDFIPLVSFGDTHIWFQIPARAIRILGGDRFIVCKQTINSVDDFYRPEDVPDPEKTNALSPRYEILAGKVDAFVKAFSEIAEIVRNAVAEAS